MVIAICIVDSSLLIEAEHRKVLSALESHLSSSSSSRKTIATPRVYDETVVEPKSFRRGYLARSASRIEKLYKRCITIEKPDYTEPVVSTVTDKVRKCIGNKSEKNEHLVELEDLQIVALAVSHALKGEDVELVFRDKTLKDCLEAILQAEGISRINIIDSSKLLFSLGKS